jgi:actin-related protein 6
MPRVVIDNGGHTCKVGFAGQDKPVKMMPNGLAKSKTEHKVFVGDQLEQATDFSSLQYRLSLERGCVVNWDTQAEVWSRAIGPEVLQVNPADCSLLLSEIPMCPPSIQNTVDEMVFEHFGFQSYCTRPAPVLAALAVQQEQAETPPRCASLGEARNRAECRSTRCSCPLPPALSVRMVVAQCWTSVSPRRTPSLSTAAPPLRLR